MVNNKVRNMFNSIKGFSVAFLIIGLAIFTTVYFSSQAKKANADTTNINSNRTISRSDLGKDVVVNSGVTYTIKPLSGNSPDHLKSLYVKSGGIVTHPKMTGSNPSSSNINLLIDETLTLEGTAKIDVSGAGYPSAGRAGTGPGAGASLYENGSDGSYGGGGSYGGKGTVPMPFNSGALGQGNTYGSATSPTDLGSSGGGFRDQDCNAWGCNVETGLGGAGGGRIHIKVNKIMLSPSSQILANGTNGDRSGGGGSGGSIWIESNLFTTGATGNPEVKAGSAGYPNSPYNAQPGTYNGNLQYGSNIQANGGQSGGGGGRIVVTGDMALPPGPYVEDKLPTGITAGDVLVDPNNPSNNPDPTPRDGDNLSQKVTWDAVPDDQDHYINFTVTIGDNYCGANGPGSGLLEKNIAKLYSVLNLHTMKPDLINAVNDLATLSAVKIYCPMKVSGDIGGGVINGGQIKLTGPALITAGSVDPSVVANTDINKVNIIRDYDISTLTDQMTSTFDALKNLAKNEGQDYGDGTNIKAKPGGWVAQSGSNPPLNTRLKGPGTVIVTSGNVTIDPNFSTDKKPIGIVSLYGDIIINSNSSIGMNISNVGLFAPNGKIIIHSSAGKFSWSGFMVGKNIKIIQDGTSKGGDIKWSGKLAKQAPPGFKDLLNAVSSVNEVAPTS